MNEEFNDNPMIDNELQVRLMNLVMGEASDFERDQLQTMMEQRAELAAYYQHLEHLHGLLCDVGVGDPALEGDDAGSSDVWQLPADQRQNLLAVLDGQSDTSTAKVILNTDRKTGRTARRSRWYAAAAIVTAACVLSALTLNSYQANRQFALARRAESLSSRAYYFDDSQSVLPKVALPELKLRAPAAPEGSEPSFTANDGRVTTWDASQGETGKDLYLWSREPSNKQTDSDFDAAPDSAWIDMKAPDASGLLRSATIGDYGQVTGAPTESDDVNASAMAFIPDETSVSDAEGGTIMLGGIQRLFRGGQVAVGQAEGNAKADGESPRDMTVTPRIIIPEQDEMVLLSGEVGDDEVGKALKEQVENIEAQIAGKTSLGRAAGDQLGYRMDPVGTKEVEIARGAVPSKGKTGLESTSQGQEYFYSNSSPQSLEERFGTPSEKGGQDAAPQAIGSPTFGDVQTEFIEDLDLVIIKGAERDVQRTLDVIDGLKERKEVGEEYGTRSDEPSDKVVASEEMKQQMRQKLEAFRKAAAEKQQQATELKKDEKQTASLLETHNNSNAKGRFAEAEVLEKKIAQSKADDYTDLMSRVNSATNVPGGSNSNTTKEVGPHWRFIPQPSPQVESKIRGRLEVERKPVEAKPAEPKPAEVKLAEPKIKEAIDEQSAARQAFSTFSLHVSDVAFKLAQSALAQGQWPDAAKMRVEEFVNALDYHDPLPTDHERVACRVEQAIHPFLMQRNLLRISMRTAATGRAQNTPLRLTIVLDNSGSMERADRRQAVLQAVQMLAAQLRPTDQVTLISFANTPRLLAEKVTGDQGASLVKLIENLPSEGGTNIEAALLLAREKALEQQVAGAQNRIVLLTDGAVNLGDAEPDSLAKLVTQLRDAGIAFDAAGISAADLNDEVLEALTRQGDGRYYLLDSADAVADSFATQIAGALRPSAQNVKVQVEFNPQRVGRYKLLGFEKHRLKQEDFKNDKVDAAELAAAEAGVAVYHYEIKPNGSGDVGSVAVRFRDLATGQMIERRWPIPYESSTPRLDQASPTMQLAAIAALFATKLSGGPAADSVDLGELQRLLVKVPEQYANQPRVVQLRTMFEQTLALQK